MRVLAIDPGYGRCGVAILEGEGSRVKLEYSACILTDAKIEFSLRLLTVANGIIDLIKRYAPDTIAIEELYFSKNQKTVFHVAEIRGMLIYIAVSHKIPLIEYNPLTVKIALTGEGRATKDQVAIMVIRLLALKVTPKYDDEVDAIALGIAAIAESRHHAVRKL